MHIAHRGVKLSRMHQTGKSDSAVCMIPQSQTQWCAIQQKFTFKINYKYFHSERDVLPTDWVRLHSVLYISHCGVRFKDFAGLWLLFIKGTIRWNPFIGENIFSSVYQGPNREQIRVESLVTHFLRVPSSGKYFLELIFGGKYPLQQ